MLLSALMKVSMLIQCLPNLELNSAIKIPTISDGTGHPDVDSVIFTSGTTILGELKTTEVHTTQLEMTSDVELTLLDRTPCTNDITTPDISIIGGNEFQTIANLLETTPDVNDIVTPDISIIGGMNLKSY